MPNWDLIKKEWETSNITLKDLAEKHGVKLGTLKSRKSREKWSRDATKKDAIQNKKVATQGEKDATHEKKVSTRKQNRKIIEEPFIENDELTDKQKLFCLYYLKYFNATKAYQKAYESEYTTSMVNGSRLLRNAKISSEIDRIKQERAAAINLDAQAVLQKYIDIAFADITDYATFGKKEVQVIGMMGPVEDEDGNPVMQEVNYVDFKESSEVDGTIITEVKKGKDGVSVKLADKMKALEFLSKYTDLLSDADKKKLQEEKLKTDIEKARAEIERLTDDGDDDASFEIVIKRKGDTS